MGNASAKPGKLATFVSAAATIRGELAGRITALRAHYDTFQALAPASVAGSLAVTNPDLMDVELPGLLVNLENDEAFVTAVRVAFESADRSLGPDGLASVDEAAFAASFDAVCRAAGIDPAVLLAERAPVTVDATWAAGIPRTSGFVADPVCTATGHFVEAEDDFTRPERLAVLRWTRTYSSRFVAAGPFGRGWASWATVALVAQDDGTVGYHGPDGQMALYSAGGPDGGPVRVAGVDAELVADDGGWVLLWDWHSVHPGDRWRFDPDGNLVSVSGPTTGTTRFTHTGGLLTALDHDSGRRLDLDWDRDRIVAVRSSCGRQARYHYDRHGDLVRTERVTGDRRYRLDPAGRILAVHDADGIRLCHNTYDDQGRVVAQVSPFGRETRLSYHPGLRTIVTDTTDGPVAIYQHDLAGRLVGLVDNDGHRLTRRFDDQGRCVEATGFDGATDHHRFHPDGRTATHTGPDGDQRWTYDHHHRVVTHHQTGGPRLTFHYDDDGPVPARITGPQGWETRLEVTDGLLRSVTDADGVTVRFDHDPDGNITTTTNALGHTTIAAYHPSGEITRLTLPDGATYTFDRDPAGRLTRTRTPMGEEFHTHWSPAGRMTALVEPDGARTTYHHGAHGAVDQITDPLGAALGIQRDHLERITGLSAPGGAKWDFTYTAIGLLSLVTDPAGGTWSYTHDPEGRLTEATDPLGHRAQQRFNPHGQLVEMVDQAGGSTRFDHDALGRVVRRTGPDGAATELAWDEWGRLREARGPDGDTVTTTYTPAGRVRSQTTGGGLTTTYDHDAAGRLAAATDGAGGTTRIEWDACDRVAAIVAPTGRARRYRYDPAGRVVETDVGGRVWRTAYDHAGRVTATTDPAGATTRYGYDLRGKVVAATDPLGHTVRYRYDERGNQTAVIDPFGGVATTTYDAMRRPVALTDQLGRTTRIQRDRAGRVVRQELPTGDAVEWQRDARGAARDVRVNGRDAVVFDRDRAGRPVLVHEPARNRTFTLAWTAGGRLRSLDVDGREMTWEYGPDGQVTARRDPAGRVTRYGHDGAGRLASVEHEGWGRVDLDRDADGTLVALRAPGLERRWDHDAGGLVVATRTARDGVAAAGSVELARDAAGRVVEARTPAGTVRYRRDAAGQLVGASRGGEAWAWHYDPAGRLAREDGPEGTRTFAYDEAHQLVRVDGPDGTTVYGYDAAGRRTTAHGPAGPRRWHWDGLGRLAAVEHDGRRRELDVDALGRLAAVDGTALTWDPTTLVPELQAIGDDRVVGAAGMVLGTAPGGEPGATRWLPGDPAAGPAATGAGAVDPWSAGHPPDGGPALDALGGLDVAGLSWLHHRAYDPGTRQFLSPDPLPGVPGSPVATNPYHYAGNDPVGCVDPLGLQPLSIDQYNDIRKQETGVQWNNVVTVGLVAAGVLLSFTGVGAVAMIAIGAGLGAIGGAAPGIIQGATGGGWDWGNIAGGALKGAVIGGLSGGIGGGIGALTTRLGTTGGAFTTTLLTGGGRFGAGARGTVFGATNGALSGTAAEAYDVLPLPGSDGSFDAEGIAVTTVVGGGLGGGVAAGRYQPPPPPRPDFVVAPNGTTMPVSQARTAAVFDEAGLQKTPLTNAQGQPNGTQYTMPDGSRVRLMEPNATADRRASFENANGQPVDWQTGKPVQRPPPQPGQPQLSGAAWKNYVRSRTHLPQDP